MEKLAFSQLRCLRSWIISAHPDGNGQAQGDKALFIKERSGMDSMPGDGRERWVHAPQNI